MTAMVLGEAFVTASIYSLGQGFPLEALVRLTNWFAAQTIKAYGAGNFPSKARIKRFLSEELSLV